MSRVLVDGNEVKKMAGPLDSGQWKQLRCIRTPEVQALPDPSFPTLKYPNPEEDGALDVAKALADANGINLVVATDPDADRLGVAQRVGSSWHNFKGDELGVLLGYHLWKKQTKAARKENPLMITSAVSSQMLQTIGHIEGFDVDETLTGFKWIGNSALQAKQAGRTVLFGYEEALGYMIPDVGVYDKDGVSAALLFLEACQSWPSLPFDMLQNLYEKYGNFVTVNTYWRSPNIELTRDIFCSIQQNFKAILAVFAPTLKWRLRDLSRGTDTNTEHGKCDLPCVSGNLMVTFWLEGDRRLENGARCSVRISGTEPKIKGNITRCPTIQPD